MTPFFIVQRRALYIHVSCQHSCDSTFKRIPSRERLVANHCP